MNTMGGRDHHSDTSTSHGPLRLGSARVCLLMCILALSGCWLSMPGTASGTQSLEREHAARVFDDPGLQALAAAAASGDAEAVRRLMRDDGIDPDPVFWGTDNGTPMLAWPILRGNPDGLRAMLESGADPNVSKPYPSDRPTPRFHGQPIVWAAQQKDPVYLQILLDHGGDPNTRNANREALLFHAFVHGNLWRNVQMLVERGADINAEVSPGSTILRNYASLGSFSMAHWLLEHGADPSLQFSFRKPVQRADSHVIEAIFWHPGDVSNPEWQVKCQRWLLANGFTRPPMPEHFRKMRQTFEFPHTEDEIPLPDMDDDGGDA